MWGVSKQFRCATLSSPHVPCVCVCVSPPRLGPAGFVRGHNGPSGPIVAVQSRGTPGRGRGQPRLKPARPPRRRRCCHAKGPAAGGCPRQGRRYQRPGKGKRDGDGPEGTATASSPQLQPRRLRPGPALPPGACAAPPRREAEAQARVSGEVPLGGGGRPFNGPGGGVGGLVGGEGDWSPGFRS